MRSALLYICLITVLATITGCESLGQGKFRGAVNYYNLEGLSYTGEFPNKVYSYPTQVGGVELAKFDLSVLEPKVAKYCKSLLEVAGTVATCFDCYTVAQDYQRAYALCSGSVAKYVNEERMAKRHTANVKAHKARVAINKENAIRHMAEYAKSNGLNPAEIRYFYQPHTLLDVVLEIRKGKVEVSKHFNVKCCSHVGYKVAQPIEGGYRLTTEHYKGLPILLKTNKTMFEGNKVGGGLGWLRYDGVSSYTTVTGAAKQAVLMTEVL